MPWWALVLVIAFWLAWVTLPEWLHLYFRWRARKLPRDVYRYDWEYGYWEWRRIGGYTRDAQGVIRWRGVPIPQHKQTGPTDEPTR